MDMRSREQYLESVRQEYRQASRKEKTRLLNEARRRTKLNRKVLIGKLAHPAAAKENHSRRRRGASYGPEVVTALIRIWELFDYPCGQRLVAVLRREVERLRKMRELRCSDVVAEKLGGISAKTVDRLLAREKRVRQLRRNRTPRMHPLLYQRVPVKVAADWDTREVGNLQVDFVEHCGRSNGGQYLHTLSTVDIASSWWEGEVIASRGQQAVQQALEAIRQRTPFRIREIHPDNDSGLINELLWNYCKDARIQMSRSRPYKKNDNAWIEQRNWTHVRKVVGYQRFDTTGEMVVLRQLYGYLRLYKNYFQPAMKLISKERVGGKIHRKYDEARTPYQRLLESGQLKASAARELRQTYEKLNVAELRRQIERLRDRLFTLAEQKTSAVPSPRRGKLELSFGAADRRREWYRRRAAGQ